MRESVRCDWIDWMAPRENAQTEIIRGLIKSVLYNNFVDSEYRVNPDNMKSL